jgi:hypothetical protein
MHIRPILVIPDDHPLMAVVLLFESRSSSMKKCEINRTYPSRNAEFFRIFSGYSSTERLTFGRARYLSSR